MKLNNMKKEITNSRFNEKLINITIDDFTLAKVPVVKRMQEKLASYCRASVF